MSDHTGPARQIGTQSLYVPTIKPADEGEPRHILTCRDGPTECGRQLEGEQMEPVRWRRDYLCPRCVQKYMRKVLEAHGWE